MCGNNVFYDSLKGAIDLKHFLFDSTESLPFGLFFIIVLFQLRFYYFQQIIDFS